MRMYKKIPSDEFYTGTLGQIKNEFITIHQFAESLSRVIDAKDVYTANHSEEVAEISYAIALSYGLNEKEAEKIHIAGHLHDIGKIAIPDKILNKKGKLTKHEWKIIKTHPLVGFAILKPVTLLTDIKDMVLYHHERYDGKGYPSGIKAEEIPLGSRIITVADAISAMLHDRPYRKAFDFEETFEELKNNSGIQFDPKVVNATITVMDKIWEIFTKRRDLNDTNSIDSKRRKS